jgi:hypothetical protein
MPYIADPRRRTLDTFIRDLALMIEHPGDLNYAISRLLSVASTQEHPTMQPGYHDLSRWRAAVIDAADEFYRRVIVPYEENKRAINGDVYHELLERYRCSR